jgi:hypothetical protein
LSRAARTTTEKWFGDAGVFRLDPQPGYLARWRVHDVAFHTGLACVLDRLCRFSAGVRRWSRWRWSGTLVIKDSTLMNNPRAGFESQGYAGTFVLASGNPWVSGSTIK